jgi:hypothetical protein
MIIAVSGFLSEDSDHHDDWKALKEACVLSEIPLFAVHWKAQTSKDISKIASDGLMQLASGLKINKNFGIPNLSAKGLLNMNNVTTLIKTVQKTTSDTSEMFKKARINAKFTGGVLGHYLAQ